MSQLPLVVQDSEPSFSSGRGTERTRRDMACINCRNSKVRCGGVSILGQPCQRCSRLGTACVVDKQHKRIGKTSRIEQLEQELRSLKQLVHPELTATRSIRPHIVLGHEENLSKHMQAPISRTHSSSQQTPSITIKNTPSNASSGVIPVTAKPPIAEPHIFGNHLLTGDEIDWYFDKYLEHFHPFLPVLRKRNPNECFDAHPTLFWVVICVASRRYCVNLAILNDLTDFLRKELFKCFAEPAVSLEGIHAALLVCAWPLPGMRQATDPSPALIGLAANASISSGFYLGKGSHPDFCFSSRGHVSVSDEEASSTHLAIYIMSQCCHAVSGIPLPPIPINELQCKKSLVNNEWLDLTMLFDVQKFLFRFYTFAFGQVSLYQGLSDTDVWQWEDAFELLEPNLRNHGSECVSFMVLTARMQIQQFYFCTLPDIPAKPEYTLRAFDTCKTLIRVITELESSNRFLSHAPHWVFRSVRDACAIIVYTLHSTFAPPDLSTTDANDLAMQSCNIVRQFSTSETDMPHRCAVVMEAFWNARYSIPVLDGGITSCRDRLGAGAIFSCAKTFRRALQSAQTSNMPTANPAFDRTYQQSLVSATANMTDATATCGSMRSSNGTPNRDHTRPTDLHGNAAKETQQNGELPVTRLCAELESLQDGDVFFGLF